MNCTDLQKIKSLTGDDILIVHDELLMRGVDYRCKTGIDLYLNKTAANDRSYIQCLGRVARGSDVGDRYYREDMELYRDRNWEEETFSIEIEEQEANNT